jgi:hypothetical protein
MTATHNATSATVPAARTIMSSALRGCYAIAARAEPRTRVALVHGEASSQEPPLRHAPEEVLHRMHVFDALLFGAMLIVDYAEEAGTPEARGQVSNIMRLIQRARLDADAARNYLEERLIMRRQGLGCSYGPVIRDLGEVLALIGGATAMLFELEAKPGHEHRIKAIFLLEAAQAHAEDSCEALDAAPLAGEEAA